MSLLWRVSVTLPVVSIPSVSLYFLFGTYLGVSVRVFHADFFYAFLGTSVSAFPCYFPSSVAVIAFWAGFVVLVSRDFVATSHLFLGTRLD
jgi:hypothetical protein